jgi:hypothetical protein
MNAQIREWVNQCSNKNKRNADAEVRYMQFIINNAAFKPLADFDFSHEQVRQVRDRIPRLMVMGMNGAEAFETAITDVIAPLLTRVG